MVVMTLEKVPSSLRGELTRWLIEIQTGVYVGRVSAKVRDLLWEKALARKAGGRITQAWSFRNEQKFAFRIAGDCKRKVIDFDGICLVAKASISNEVP